MSDNDTDDQAENQSDELSVFQKAMAQTGVVSHDPRQPRFNHYPQREKPPPNKPATDSISTAIPTAVVIDQTQGEGVLFVRSGLQRKRIKQLKHGDYPCRSVLDLHGMRVYQAEPLLSQFLSEAVQQNMSCVLIIHGKGHHSENQQGVLKPLTINRLKESAEVMAFCSAQPKDGGSGAVYVLLKRATG